MNMIRELATKDNKKRTIKLNEERMKEREKEAYE
jgi:hypothetical protein